MNQIALSLLIVGLVLLVFVAHMLFARLERRIKLLQKDLDRLRGGRLFGEGKKP